MDVAERIGQWLEDNVEVALLGTDWEVHVTRLFAAPHERSERQRRRGSDRAVDLVAVRGLELPVQRGGAVAVADLDRHL